MNASLTPDPQTPEDPKNQEYAQYASYHEVEAAQKITMQDIKEHMTGPVVSMIFHAIVISFLGTMIISAPPDERKDIEVKMVKVEIKELKEKPEPPKKEEVEIKQEVEIENPDVVSDVPVEVEDAPMVDAPQDFVIPNVTVISDSDSKLVLTGVMSPRSGEKRKKAIDEGGGSKKTEAAVDGGLRWLRDHQNPDGSWGQGGNQAFLTSIALLTFLGHGETPKSPEYGACILKAIRKLIDMVNTRKGLHVDNDKSTYGHAAVAYALSEAYALTKIPMVETAMNTMVETLVSGQAKHGGYNYSHNNRANEKGVSRFDLSLGGWHFQALKAAFAAGSSVSGIENAIQMAMQGMKKEVYVAGGGFQYSNLGTDEKEKVTPTMSAVGALCLQLLGDPVCKEVTSTITWFQTANAGEAMKCNWKGIRDYKSKTTYHWPLYQWYYQTQAIFQNTGGKGAVWNDWNKSFQTELLREQYKDGHWTSPHNKYTPEPDKIKSPGENIKTFHGQLDLDIYSTAMCTLMLEVYYRYLPTFKVVAAPPPTQEGAADSKKSEISGLIIE